MRFDKKVLILGYGAVSQCTLPLLPRHIKLPWKNITVIDFEDKREKIKHFTKKGVKFYQQKIEQDNLDSTLSQHLEKGDLLIDLAWNIGANDIIGWCHNHEVLYVNTSVEQWNPMKDVEKKSPFEKSLYYRQMQLREMSKNWKNATTAVVDHGANPGLISHFTKQGLLDISERLIEDKKVNGKELEEILHYRDTMDFANLAYNLGVKVIHCSERDTQITSNPKKVDEFVGTWSIEGLREEGTAPAELGW